jgi:hypothetical protein
MKTLPVQLKRIEVTAEVIKKAERNSHTQCMFAKAIKLAARDAKVPVYASVNAQRIQLRDRRHRQSQTFLTPKSMQQALLDFDRGIHIKPFAFTLPQPVKTERWQPAKKLSKRTTARRSAIKASKSPIRTTLKASTRLSSRVSGHTNVTTKPHRVGGYQQENAGATTTPMGIWDNRSSRTFGAQLTAK